MDTGLDSPRELAIKQFGRDSDTRDTLARAAMQRRKYKLDEYFIVDVDAHHFENQSWSEVLTYVTDPVVRQIAESFKARGFVTPGILGGGSRFPTHQNVGGRIPHDPGLEEPHTNDENVPRDVVLARRAIETIGIDYQVSFPTPMLGLGGHPELDVEIALALGYNRWLTERVLPHDNRVLALCYLPFNDPDSAIATVEEFGEKKGVKGFTITGTKKPVHHNDYMRLYAMLEERGLPLAFHAGLGPSQDGFFRQLNRFISMHALSFSFSNMVHLANWVMNGLNEKFPKLKVLWIESGIAWMAFMTQRFDNEYLMRTSEAPALKRLPSEYMREMYYTTQPMERTNLELLEATMAAIDAPRSVVYASDWPHWDFDLPSTILDLPFLDDAAKRNILGLTAKRIFNL
jgi:predicted TIM-barrel fold metal-dependent hydrolase